VVAVDPPASDRGDACGIVVAGRSGRFGYVLADLTVKRPSPDAWALRVIAAAREFEADAIVAESNQGGDMVRSTLATREPPCAVRLVHASKGKRARAEPVAALYEQGRIVHCGAFPALEEELMALGSDDLKHSPDRADALVWALTDLMLGGRKEPRLRAL
jgi:phage terminase large subunit-like protein